MNVSFHTSDKITVVGAIYSIGYITNILPYLVPCTLISDLDSYMYRGFPRAAVHCSTSL